MRIRLNRKMIKELCGPVSYKRGESFHRSNKVKINQHTSDFSKAVVRGVEDFHVTIASDAKGDFQTACSCPTLANFQKPCQHTAAVLLAIYDLQRQGKFSASEIQPAGKEGLTEEFITLFHETPIRKSGHQFHFENREILEVLFTCKPFLTESNHYLLGINVEVNGKRIRHIQAFLQDIKEGKTDRLSSGFLYDSGRHCFLTETDAVIRQLIRIVHEEQVFLETVTGTAGDQSLLIPPSSWKELLPLLAKAPGVRIGMAGDFFEGFQIAVGKPPLQFIFEEKETSDYRLIIDGFEQMIVLRFYNAVLSEGKYFQLEEQEAERLHELKQMLASPDVSHIPIPKEHISFFLKKIVPGLKKIGNVHLAKSLSRALLETPLVAKLYLDRLKNRLLAGLEFQYGNVVIQPLENRDTAAGPMIVRDVEKEEEILQILDDSGFSKTEGGYFMQNEELEYNFLYHVIPELQSKIQLYATTAIRNRIVRKNTFPAINVKVKKQERTDWLEFKFEMDDVPEKQIKEILMALEEKRKYYRLRNGALLSLETREMEEIQRFLHAAPIQKQAVGTSLSLPVNESIQLFDSLGESNIFTVEETFQKLLDQLYNPDNLDMEVPVSMHGVLRNYQVTGYKWMKTLAGYGFGGVLADDMGLGKTVQSIAFILSVLPDLRNRKQPALIVCPSSVTYNWLDEITRFAPELQARVIDGSKTNREELYKGIENIDVVIISYPLLRRDVNWFEKQAFHTVFFDEAQAFKNPATQTAKAVKKIKAEHRFALTGTPIENALEELWSIFHVVYPQLFQGLKEYSFLSRKKVARRVRPFLLRRMKRDVLSELPVKNQSLQTVELLPAQKELYAAYLAKLRHDTLKHLDQDTVRKNRIKILAGLTRLRQICCHPSLFVDGYQESSAKYEKLLQILEESKYEGRRVLIFSQFTKMLHLIGRELSMRGESYFYLDGQTPSEERVELCNRFNEGERDVFLISLKAGGTGLNLTGADTVILYDLWWNPAVEEQAADRAHRIGQKNQVEVIKLVARGTIEEKMNQLQEKKRQLISEIIEPKEHPTATWTEEDIREILMM